MSKRIAVLMSGIIREDVNEIIANICNIKTQLSCLGQVDVYFHTWEPQGKYMYEEEALNRIRNEVYFLLTSPFPEKFPDEYNIRTLENPPVHSYNVLCMLYAIGQLCRCVTEDYDYVCRLRNDLYLQDNFKTWGKLIDNKSADYIYPMSLWTFYDCCNDHFGMATKENFMKLWRRDWFQLRKDFKEINDCPEKMLLHKLRENKMNVFYVIPKSYRYKGVDMISNGEVQIDTLNGYMQGYMTQFLNTYKGNKIFNLNIH